MILVNNAGTLGDISKHIKDYDGLEDMHAFMMTNITSAFFFTLVLLLLLCSERLVAAGVWEQWFD